MAFFRELHGRTLAAAVPTLAAALALGGCSSDDSNDGSGGGASSTGGGGTGGAGGASGGGTNGGAGPTGSPNWTMLGYDAQSTYWNKGETKITRETAGSLVEKWSMDLGGNINSAPLQVDGVIYTGSSVNRNVAIDIESQQILWENIDFLASATFAYADGVLYVHDFGGMLLALDPATGTVNWSSPTTDQGSIGFSSPTLVGDLILIGGSNAMELLPNVPVFRGFVFAADRTAQGQAWNTMMVPEGSTGASLWSSLSADPADGTVYAGTGNNYTNPATDSSDAIIELSLADGTINWKAQRYEGDTWSVSNSAGGPDYDFGTNPIVFEAEINGTMTKLVAAGQKSGDFHVLNREADGAEIAKRNLSPGSANGSSGIFNNGAWDGTHLLVAANGATSAEGEPKDSNWAPAVLFALDPATLDVVWERQMPGPVMAPLTVANGVVFVPSDRHLLAYNTDTGEKLLDHVAASTIASAPTISDGRVAFGQGIQWSVGSTGTMLTVLELP